MDSSDSVEEIEEPETMDQSKLDADREKNRILRKKYQDLIAEIQTRGQNDNTDLSESFEKADELFASVSKPREAILDSEFVNLHASLVKQKTKSLHTNLLEFKPEEFVIQFEHFINSKVATPRKRSHSEMIRQLGNISRRIIPIHPSCCCLFNTLEITPAAKRVRQPKTKDDEFSKVVQKAKTIDTKGKDNTDKDIHQEILRALKKLNPDAKSDGAVCYFSFVVNPHSFAETIENMFYVSVLAREGAVEIGLDKYKLPFIKPVEVDEMKKVKLYGSYTQSIISFDEHDWKRIIKEYGITTPIIKRKECV